MGESVPWRESFRGFVPTLGRAGLEALREALQANSHRLLQGSTTTPSPMLTNQDHLTMGACPIGYCGWEGHRKRTVSEVQDFFALACQEASSRLGGGWGCRFFLNWWDDTPRDQAVPLLLEEVELALAQDAGQNLSKE